LYSISTEEHILAEGWYLTDGQRHLPAQTKLRRLEFCETVRSKQSVPGRALLLVYCKIWLWSYLKLKVVRGLWQYYC